MNAERQQATMFCAHANEVPLYCPCQSDCYCKSNTCRKQELLEDASMTRGSVQPDWCRSLTFQQQSVLMLAARGPDGIEKISPVKNIVRAYRSCVFKAAFLGRELAYGEDLDSFMSLRRFASAVSWAEDIRSFFDNVDGLPHHYYQHLILGAEILGYKHPDKKIRTRWHRFYLLCVENLHMNAETEEQMDARLSDKK